MPRKPYFREFDGWWYAQIRVGTKRKQVKLVKGRENEQQAYRAFYRLLAAEVGKVPEPTAFAVASVCDLFLEYSHRHHEPDTYAWYKSFLQDFCGACGRLAVSELKPFHVNRWMDSHEGWGPGGRRHAITCVKRALSWAEAEGLIPTSPVRGMKKPAGRSRERILSAEERRQILAAIRDRSFREFVLAMQQTGCRPSEVARVTAADVNLERGVWTLKKHKTSRRTGKPRLVYLTPTMIELTRKLMAKFADGPLFRGPRGDKPFTRNAIRCRFRRLREKFRKMREAQQQLPAEQRKKVSDLTGVVSYCYRHSFVTDALANGVPAAAVAELVGHKDLKMIQDHYSHLAEKAEFLRKSAEQATREE